VPTRAIEQRDHPVWVAVPLDPSVLAAVAPVAPPEVADDAAAAGAVTVMSAVLVDVWPAESVTVTFTV